MILLETFDVLIGHFYFDKKKFNFQSGYEHWNNEVIEEIFVPLCFGKLYIAPSD